MTLNRLLIGTYTPREPEPGVSRGIYEATFDDANGEFTVTGLAAEAQSPAFLTQYGKFVYSVNELDPGRVSAFALTDDGLAFLNTVPTDGAYPCHLAATADWLSVANYSTGSIATFRIDDGVIGERVDFAQHTGAGPNPVRQKSAHAHQTYLATDRDMLVPDLGGDRLYWYRIDATGALVGEPGVTQLAAGTGPRHVERHPTLPVLYVINELGNTIDVLERDPGNPMRILQTVSTLPDDFAGTSTTSEIAVSPDGRFVYGSNRGHDSIVSFAIDEAGRLSEPEYTSTRGAHPRFFTLDPGGRWLLAANQNSDNVVVFALQDGRLRDAVCETGVPRPVCLLFLDPSALNHGIRKFRQRWRSSQ